MTTVDQEIAPREAPDPSYRIDLSFIEESGRSAFKILESRLCPACVQKFEKSKDPSKLKFDDLRKCLQQSCSKDANFVTPQMPLLECAFRLLLASTDELITLAELHRQVIDLWSNAPWPRHISADSLARALAGDTYYGIIELREEVE
jgi:hypothetical protein